MLYRLSLYQTTRFCVYLLVLIGSIGLLVVFSTKVNAVGFSLSIDPPVTFIQMAPGDMISTPIRITNEADDPINLSILLKPFTAKNDKGEAFLTDEPLPIEPFVSIFYEEKPIKELRLLPKESLDLMLHIALPASHDKDSYFSIIFVAKDAFLPRDLQNKPETAVVTAFSQLQPGVGTNIIVSIKDESRNNLSVELKTDPFFESGPVDFALQIINHGKRAQSIQGTLFIRNLFGQTVGKIDLPPLYILAESARTYPKLSFEETFLLGPYVASLAIQENNTQQVVFFGIPYQATGGMIITIFIILIAIVRIRRRLRFS